MQAVVLAPTPAQALTGARGDARPAGQRPNWRNPIGLLGAAIILFTIVAATGAPLIARYDPASQAARRLLTPGADHLMGTDQLGRDTFSRVVYGARVSLEVGIVAVGIALAVGSLLGILSGCCGRRLDDVVMRLVDVMSAFPTWCWRSSSPVWSGRVATTR